VPSTSQQTTKPATQQTSALPYSGEQTGIVYTRLNKHIENSLN